MSSPRKRIKLTPRKEKRSSELRHTQDSKVTSTPQRQSAKISTPDISSIATAPNVAHSIRAHFSSSSSSTSSRPVSPASITGSEQSGILAVEDYDAYINTSQRIKYQGKIWTLHKPSNDGTLYAQVIHNPKGIKHVVTELLQLYDKKPKQAMLSLLQFCVDVCGFQNFEVADEYYSGIDTLEMVIKMIESNHKLQEQKVLIGSGRYLFMEPPMALTQFLKVTIYSFLQKLIMEAYRKGFLYDNFFADHFFVFVKCMSCSRLSAIQHTGFIFGIKILTAVVMIYSSMEEEENSNDSSCNLEEHKQAIKNYLEFFYLVFVKNCLIQDKKLTQMRVEFVYEVSIWVRYFPSMFITHFQCAHFLTKLIMDHSKTVRNAVLETFEAFVNTPIILSLLKKYIPDFIETIGKRFFDVDDKVATKSIDIYRNLLRRDKSLISTDRFKIIMRMVFDELFPIGEAASKFLVSYLERTEDGPAAVLMQLARFSMKPGNAIKQLLVEGCLSSCSEIRNWELYLNIFLNRNIELEIKNNLAELFAEAVHQVLIGKATILRLKSRKVVIIDTDEHQKVASHFLTLRTLLENYADHPQILTEFLKVFTTVRDTVLNDITPNCLKKICVTIKDLFFHHDDETLVKKLADTFHCFFQCATHAYNVQSIIKDLFSNYKTELEVGLKNQHKYLSQATLKLSVLFEHFDLSENFTWESLFDHWGSVDEASTANLMCCCKCYLIWYLRNLTVENYANKASILARMCTEFTSTCFNMLQHLNGQPLHFKTYDCLCDMYVKYTTELDELIKSAKQMERLSLVIDYTLDDVLVSFLEKYVICSTTMPLAERRVYVIKYVNLVHVEVLPSKSLANIFRYYHLYNKEYGPMIEASFSEIAVQNEDVFVMLILHTVTVVYQQILSKNPVINMATQDVPNLKLLIKQILTLKEFKSPGEKLLKFIFFSINYSTTEDIKYPFLYFVKYVADRLVEEKDRNMALKFLREHVPIVAQKNDAVLFLANYLKSLKFVSTRSTTKSVSVPKKSSKENIKPKKNNATLNKSDSSTSRRNTRTAKSKSKIEKWRKRAAADTETDLSDDDLTIHDSESDDMEESFSLLNT